MIQYRFRSIKGVFSHVVDQVKSRKNRNNVNEAIKIEKIKKIKRSTERNLFSKAKLLIITLAVISGNTAIAESINNSANTIHFNDNSSVSFQASINNINRIFVQGDRIIKHVAPQGTFVFDKALSKDGSLYFKPVYHDAPFSIFFSTEKGHHFSALVSPTSSVGQTIEMIANNVTNADMRWEKDDGYLKLLQVVMKSMISGKSSHGIQIQKVTTTKPFQGYPDTTMTLVKVVNAGKVDGFVYEIKNTSAFDVTLVERKFYRQGVRAVSLSQRHLKPHQSGFVYTIVSTGAQ